MEIRVSEISQRLADQVEAICAHLLPGGKRERGEYVAGDVAGGTGKSLKVRLEGQYSGHWRDWAAGENGEERGDLLDLWRMARSLTPAQAIREAKNWLGIRDAAVGGRAKTYAAPPADVGKPLNFEGKAAKFLTESRGLKQSTLTRFKIESSAEKSAIVFPCYSPAGALVNRSYRTLPKQGEKKKVWQDTGCAPCLFGWHGVNDDAYQTRTIILSEGQIDCMTWAQWGFNALSIPNGSGQTWIDFEWDNLEVFDHIYLSFDMDTAGEAILQKTISRLGPHRCLLLKLPHKDANDCLVAGCSSADAKDWIAAAKPPRITGLVTASDLRQRLEEEMKPKPEAFNLPFLAHKWPDRGIFFRPGEVTVWTGPPFCGKSTILNYIAMILVSAQTAVFIASMEVKPETTLRRTFGPLLGNKPEMIGPFFDQAGHLILFADVVGYISEAELLEMMMFSFRRYGAMHFIIDSLMRIKGLEEEYAKQGDFINALSNFAKTTGTHVHLVAHSRKLQEGQRADASKIKGSTMIHGNADNVIAVSRNAAKDKLRMEAELTADQDREMHDTEIYCEKQRESGWVGGFKLRFNPRNYSFSTFTKSGI